MANGLSILFGLTIFPSDAAAASWCRWYPGSDHLSSRLLQLLIDTDRARRPTAAELLVHPCLQPASCRSRAQLRRQLNAERLENQLLRSQLADISTHCSPERGGGGGRSVGRGTPRSRSTTF